jgi:hypothetical protein
LKLVPRLSRPSDFIDVQLGPGGRCSRSFGTPAPTGAIADAARLSGDARLNAYARLDRDPRRASCAVSFASTTTTHFFSARMGCPLLHPIYGPDLAALLSGPPMPSELALGC